MSTHKITRARKALVAAVAAGLAAFGAAMAEGQDWRAGLGMAAAAALIAGTGTYAVPNRLSSEELMRLAKAAAEREQRHTDQDQQP